jgi:outer membrane immunogenic protein
LHKSALGIPLAILAMTVSASAADMPVKASPRAAAAFSWAGTYIGAVGSAGIMNSEMSDQWCATACDAPDMARWGGAIGLTLGHNFQSGSLVYGIEGDGSWAWFRQSLTNSDSAYVQTSRAKWDWYATLRGRLGLAFDRTLVYATGGVAFVGAKYSNRYSVASTLPTDEGFSFSDTQVGIAAGVGVERAFTNNLSFKAEYLYIGLPSVTRSYDDGGVVVPGDWMTWKSHAHLLRVGLNYRWGDAALPVPGASPAAYPVKAPVRGRPALAYSWAGSYVGVVGSVGMMGSEMSDRGCWTACDAPDMARWGGAVGATLGHNFQSGALVYGVEADGSWAWFRQSLTISEPSYSLTHRAEWDWYATLRGRMGLAVDRTLFYVTGGAAFVGAKYSNRYSVVSGVPTNEGFSFRGTQVGIAAGGGVEHAFSESMSFKAEYLYIGLPSVTRNYNDNGVIDPDQYMTWKSNAHLLRLGLNHRFGAAPAQAVGPTISWAGSYIGGVGSVGVMGTEMSDQWGLTAFDAPDMARWGGALGATLGHNLQAGEYVYGVEVDGSWAWFRQTLTVTAPVTTHRANWDWYATARARVGLAVDRTLVYVTGGAAFVGAQYSNVDPAERFDFERTQVGVALGAGVEHAVSQATGFKFEYLYIGLPSVTRDFVRPGCSPGECLMTWKSDAHLLRFGWNYRWGAGPVAARY